MRATADLPRLMFMTRNPAPSTRRMAERFQHFHETDRPGPMARLSDNRVELPWERLANAFPTRDHFRLRFNLAVEHIHALRPNAAINTFATMEKRLRDVVGG